MKRIAFRAPNWLGDAVLATVVPPAIARAHADASVTVLVKRGLGDVFRGAPAVDRVVEVDRGHEVDAYREGGYDLVLLAPTSLGEAWRAWRGGVRRRLGFATARRGFLLDASLPGREYRRDRHQVENYRALASLAGEPSEADVPQVVPGPDWSAAARRLWPETSARRVALQPGATYGPAKRWSASRYAGLARALHEEGCSVAVLGGPGERETLERFHAAGPGPVVDLAGSTSVGVLAGVLRSADLLVTNDSGPMHLAAAVGTRTLALFGSTSPVWTRPWGDGHRVLDHPVSCAPCFQRTCRIGYLCLEGIGLERVEAEAIGMLAERVS